jgi:hypothetical protein
MNELATILEWLGTGLAGLLIIVVMWMVAALVTRGRRDQDWE